MHRGSQNDDGHPEYVKPPQGGGGEGEARDQGNLNKDGHSQPNGGGSGRGDGDKEKKDAKAGEGRAPRHQCNNKCKPDGKGGFRHYYPPLARVEQRK